MRICLNNRQSTAYFVRNFYIRRAAPYAQFLSTIRSKKSTGIGRYPPFFEASKCLFFRHFDNRIIVMNCTFFKQKDPSDRSHSTIFNAYFVRNY